jgi:hypothetical protein
MDWVGSALVSISARSRPGVPTTTWQPFNTTLSCDGMLRCAVEGRPLARLPHRAQVGAADEAAAAQAPHEAADRGDHVSDLLCDLARRRHDEHLRAEGWRYGVSRQGRRGRVGGRARARTCGSGLSTAMDSRATMLNTAVLPVPDLACTCGSAKWSQFHLPLTCAPSTQVGREPHHKILAAAAQRNRRELHRRRPQQPRSLKPALDLRQQHARADVN